MLSRSQIDELAEEGVFLGNIYEITQAIEAAIAASQPSPTAKAADSVLEDAARLDWLALAGPTSICVVIDRPHDREVEVSTDDVTGYGKTLREALDAARKQAAPKAAPGEPIWWRKSADEIEAQVAMTGSPEAMRCYTDMRALLQAVTEAAPQQEAQEPCPTCAALARTVMLDQTSFDRRPDCYGIRQITDDEGVEEWEDIRTSPDVAREEANDMMATGRGEMYEVVPLWTTPQPAPAPLSDDAERLEWLLWKLPGDALRYAVGELADTSSGAEFRAAIDAAIAAQGGK